jgi:hypothetical protein
MTPASTTSNGLLLPLLIWEQILTLTTAPSSVNLNAVSRCFSSRLNSRTTVWNAWSIMQQPTRLGNSVSTTSGKDRTQGDYTAIFASLSEMQLFFHLRCPVRKIEWLDSTGIMQTLDYFFSSGQRKGQSKGLWIMSQELGLKLPSNILLADLKNELLKHPALNNVSRA